MSLSDVTELFKEGPLARALVVLVSIMLAYVAGKMAGRGIERALSTALDKHQIMVAKKLAFYGVLVLGTLTGLNEAGINLSVLVGAAGVVSVAVGFASQTTMSNLISGIFMLIERPFMSGDLIRIGSTTGEVTAVGLLSTILKTAENTMVRIPNESLMKSEITNLTRYPLRRVELEIGIPYSADIGRARLVILGAVSELTVTCMEPEPSFMFKSFGESAVNVSVAFWVAKDRVLDAQLMGAEAVKKAMDLASIEMPFPQRSLSFAADQKLRVEVLSS